MSAFDNEMVERWLHHAVPRPIAAPVVETRRYWQKLLHRLAGYLTRSDADAEPGEAYSKRIARACANDTLPEVGDKTAYYRDELIHVLEHIENVIFIEEIGHPSTNASRSLRLLHFEVTRTLHHAEPDRYDF